MELLQLKYFCLIAEKQNITRVAEELMITQPSLSKTIKKLEDEVGVPLFDRIKGKIVLNEYGKAFYQYVQKGLLNIDDGVRQLRDMTTQNNHVTLLASSATGILAHLCMAFQTAHPEIKLTVERLQHKLQTPTVNYDILISESIGVPVRYRHIVLCREMLGITVPPGHPLYQLDRVSMSQTEPYGFIAYPKGRNTRDHLDKLCSRAGFSPRIQFEMDHTSMYVGCIHKALALLSFFSYYYQYQNLVRFLRIDDPESVRTLCISWDPAKYITPAVKTFREFCVEYFHQQEELQRKFFESK